MRRRLSYATVVSALTAFLLLAGGAAYAGSQLAKNSVGSKQLKKNSVTAKKIKKNAVTTAKIKKDAVSGAKVKDGSLTGANFDVASSSFYHVVHEARGSGTATAGLVQVPVPLDNATYTQPAGRDDFYAGAVDFTFAAGCEGQREAFAFLLIDAVNPAVLTLSEIVAFGRWSDETPGAASKRVSLGSFEVGGVRLQQAAPVNHTLTLAIVGSCESGSGISAANAAVDVLGVK